ncbi:hypothetical protein CIK05_05545 [Bdellovibrio sp. qaytius]|nr:hypothetical protein CIK05_05545 [Bdellovibrio sp. qaytius]
MTSLTSLTSLQLIRNFAIIFIYAVLFGTAAYDKWQTLSMPEWFGKQFEKTFIRKLPGGAAVGYWFIASLEALLALVFVISIFNFVLLPYALLGSLFLFGILLFGLRITYDFQGSANMFVYFGTTLLSLFFVTMS